MDNYKKLVIILIAVIVIFFLVFSIRSCSDPETYRPAWGSTGTDDDNIKTRKDYKEEKKMVFSDGSTVEIPENWYAKEVSVSIPAMALPGLQKSHIFKMYLLRHERAETRNIWRVDFNSMKIPEKYVININKLDEKGKEYLRALLYVDGYGFNKQGYEYEKEEWAEIKSENKERKGYFKAFYKNNKDNKGLEKVVVYRYHINGNDLIYGRFGYYTGKKVKISAELRSEIQECLGMMERVLATKGGSNG